MGLVLPCLTFGGCTTGAIQRPEFLGARAPATRTIDFHTFEFTRPFLDVSPDGSEIFFNVLGEIYRVPIDGGEAVRLDLGEGWKERPMISPDGRSIAFLSDRGGEVAVWRQRIDGGGPSSAEQADRRDVTTAAWLDNAIIASSGVDTTSNAAYSLAAGAMSPEGATIQTGSVQARIPARAASMSADEFGNLFFARAGEVKMVRRSTGVESTVIDFNEEASQPRVMKDGARLGYVAKHGDRHVLMLMELANGSKSPTRCELPFSPGDLSGTGSEATYDFLPDGRGIVFAGDGRIYRCDFDGSTTRIDVSAHVQITVQPGIRPSARAVGQIDSHPTYLTRSPGEDEVAFGSQSRIWRVRHGRPPQRLTDSDAYEEMPAYSPTGRQLAFVAIAADGRSELRVHDLITGEKRIAYSTERRLLNPAWDPSGDRLAFVEADFGPSYAPGSIRWTKLNGEGGLFGEIERADNPENVFPILTWSGDGSGLFYARGQEGKRQLLFHRLGEEPVVLLQAEQRVHDIRVSPDGRYVAFQHEAGIAVSPMIASSFEQHLYTLDQVLGMSQVVDNSAVHFSWSGPHSLIWISGEDAQTVDIGRTPETFASLRLVPQAAPPVGRVAYVGARIITMADQGVIENGVIITSNNHIEFVGVADDDPDLSGAQRVDASGQTIIPGLIDAHFHSLTHTQGEARPLTQRLFAAAAYGVTTVYDPNLTTVDTGVILEMSQSDDFAGPTYYGSGLAILGATGTAVEPDIRSYEDASALVRERARSGARVIKEYLQPTRQRRRWLADAARQWGVGITTHAKNDLRSPLTAIMEGYTAFEHNMVFEPVYSDVIEFIVRSGTNMTPTLGVVGEGAAYMYTLAPPTDERFQCLGGSPGYLSRVWPASPSEAHEAYEGSTGADVARYSAAILNAGGEVSVGGHGARPGIDTHWEMWLLANGGATPMNVLRAATVNGARKLALEDRIGSLKVGLDADFIILNGNPLDDIRNTVEIARVVRRGRTLSWPQGPRPGGWTSIRSWDSCRRWNLGLTAD